MFCHGGAAEMISRLIPSLSGLLLFDAAGGAALPQAKRRPQTKPASLGARSFYRAVNALMARRSVSARGSLARRVHSNAYRPTRALTIRMAVWVVEVNWDGTPALLASLRNVSSQRAQEERRRQSQKLGAIGRLAAGIVHDINNLIAAFDSGLRLLQKQLAENPGDPKSAILIDELLKRTQNGGALTQQLLAFSRRQSLTPEGIDLNGRIEQLSMLLERTLGSAIKIERNLEAALGPVLVDPNQLDVAMLNLDERQGRHGRRGNAHNRD